MNKLLVAVSTYNEAESIIQLLNEIQQSISHADILIVDDSSIDGTSDLIKNHFATSKTVKLVTRPCKLGVGSAHLYAMLYAINYDYSHLITMDADFSHNPSYLPLILEKLNSYSFVIGSRYVKGGSCEYPISRQILSLAANSLVRLLLGVPLHETTTSYRGFSTELLRQILCQGRLPEGYAFFFEIVSRICKKTNHICEIPIIFEDRRTGATKISAWEILRAIAHLLRSTISRVISPTKNHHPIDRTNIKCPCCKSREVELRYGPRVGNDSNIAGSDRYACSTSTHAARGSIVDCVYCGNAFLYPQPSSSSVQQSYENVVDEIYASNLSAREDTFRYNWNRIRSEIPTNGKLLDIGSYCGAFLHIANNSSLVVQGLEPSRWAAEFCKKHYNIPVINGSSNELPVCGAPFDVITAWDVLEHVPDPNQFLTNVNQSLALNGVFCFSTLNIDSWFPKLTGPFWPWYIDMHLIYFRGNTIAHLLKKNGFEIINIRPYCHIITFEYLAHKVEALDIIGGRFMRKIAKIDPLKNLKIPFRFGDIMLITCRKITNNPKADYPIK